jgi:hypothetical protein
VVRIMANMSICDLDLHGRSLANYCLLQVPVLRYVYLETKYPRIRVFLLTMIACGSRICSRCRILHGCLGKCMDFYFFLPVSLN